MKIRKATVVTNKNGIILDVFPGEMMDYFNCWMIVSYRDSEEIRNKNEEELE